MKILDNAKEYLDFLKKEDEYGTIAEKIISIAKFRIPYYVGPLSRRHKEEGSNLSLIHIYVYKRQPMESITIYLYRNIYEKLFGEIDKYYTCLLYTSRCV